MANFGFSFKSEPEFLKYFKIIIIIIIKLGKILVLKRFLKHTDHFHPIKFIIKVKGSLIESKLMLWVVDHDLHPAWIEICEKIRIAIQIQCYSKGF